MSDQATWTEDVCTCGHGVGLHKDGDGRCSGCDENAAWNQPGASRCLRFQWNGTPRRRTW